VDESGGNRRLRQWLLRIETAYPGSTPWEDVIRDMADERSGIRTHVHGEYAAKIGLFSDGRMAGTPTSEQLTALREFQAGQRGKALLNTLHAGVAPKGALCTPCHSDASTLVDFKKLGYPPARVRSLQDSAVVRQILSIEQGRPFHLPTIEEDRGGR
jgi:hypothetical protein